MGNAVHSKGKASDLCDAAVVKGEGIPVISFDEHFQMIFTKGKHTALMFGRLKSIANTVDLITSAGTV